jgi:hypothetical protein
MGMKHSYYLTIDDGQFFWTGSGWSAEYPDAFLFSSKREATAHRKMLAARYIAGSIVLHHELSATDIREER